MYAQSKRLTQPVFPPDSSSSSTPISCELVGANGCKWSKDVYKASSSYSQMSWSPMRWIVLCFSTNHSWMYSKPFTSMRIAIWPSHIFTSLSTPTLTLKRISSKQRGHAYPRQIMRMNCSWSVGRARCIKWLMKCYSTMSVYEYEDVQARHCHHVCNQPLVDCFLNNSSPVIYLNAFINRSAVK